LADCPTWKKRKSNGRKDESDRDGEQVFREGTTDSGEGELGTATVRSPALGKKTAQKKPVRTPEFSSEWKTPKAAHTQRISMWGKGKEGRKKMTPNGELKKAK